MKIATAWILILVLTLPLGLTGWYLNWQKHKIKKAVKKELIAQTDKDKLELSKFKKSELNLQVVWKHAKEFSYKGEMYDIVNSQSINDSIFYWCWVDNEETSLNIKLKEWVDSTLGQDTQRAAKTHQVFQFCSSWFSEFNSVQFGAPSLLESDIIHHYTISIPIYFPEGLSPPPENS